jgi:hypothetical protein
MSTSTAYASQKPHRVDGSAYLSAVENAACRKPRSVTSGEPPLFALFVTGNAFLFFTHCHAVYGCV